MKIGDMYTWKSLVGVHKTVRLLLLLLLLCTGPEVYNLHERYIFVIKLGNYY